MTAETDPGFNTWLSGVNPANWDTAYGWGDHSTVGYLLPGNNVSSLANDANYVSLGDNVSGLANDAGYVALGDNVSGLTNDAGYLTSESDPVFTASAASGIGAGDITNWNTAYGWGDHSTAGYLTSESDPVFTASAASGIGAGDITNWNTAYGWGDHSTAGYITSESDTVVANIGNGIVTSDGAGTIGFITDNSANWDTAYGWGDHSTAGYLTTESDPNALLITNNLSDLNNVSTARGNLGLSSSDDVAFNSLGLSDVLSLIPQTNAPAGGSDGDMYFDDSGAFCGYGNGGWNIVFDTTAGSGNCS